MARCSYAKVHPRFILTSFVQYQHQNQYFTSPLPTSRNHHHHHHHQHSTGYTNNINIGKKSHIQTFRTPDKCFQFHSVSCAPFDPAIILCKNIRHWAHKYYFIEFFNKANLHCLQWLVEWPF